MKQSQLTTNSLMCVMSVDKIHTTGGHKITKHHDYYITEPALDLYLKQANTPTQVLI